MCQVISSVQVLWVPINAIDVPSTTLPRTLSPSTSYPCPGQQIGTAVHYVRLRMVDRRDVVIGIDAGNDVGVNSHRTAATASHHASFVPNRDTTSSFSCSISTPLQLVISPPALSYLGHRSRTYRIRRTSQIAVGLDVVRNRHLLHFACINYCIYMFSIFKLILKLMRSFCMHMNLKCRIC